MTDNTKLIQGTPEWHEARRGKITGSRFKDVLSTRGATRTNYMRELILERKTKVVAESFSNAEMEWGTQTEPIARAYYEKLANVKVDQVGFVEYLPISEVERIEFGQYVGVSPDGLVGRDGCIEIKCPNSKTHLEYMAKAVLPSTYKPQVQGILWVTKRKWCDFISFDPRVKEQPYWCIRIERDEDYINKLAAAVSVFIDEMVKMQIEIQDVDPQLLMDVTGGGNEDDWLLAKQMEIRGKVRHGVSCSILQASKEEILEPLANLKEIINKWVDYIMTGE